MHNGDSDDMPRQTKARGDTVMQSTDESAPRAMFGGNVVFEQVYTDLWRARFGIVGAHIKRVRDECFAWTGGIVERVQTERFSDEDQAVRWLETCMRNQLSAMVGHIMGGES
jgi:hypothetical protein